MATIITYDKLGIRRQVESAVEKNQHRIELEVESEENKYVITYEFQGTDKKKRSIYTEVDRRLL